MMLWGGGKSQGGEVVDRMPWVRVRPGSPFGIGHEKVGEGDLASRPVEGRASEDKAGVGEAIAEATWGEGEAVAATSR